VASLGLSGNRHEHFDLLPPRLSLLLWNEGTWTSRVRIWSFHQYDPVESLVRPALEARYPVQAVCATGKGGSIPTSGQGKGAAP
jgi:hypothetical protein